MAAINRNALALFVCLVILFFPLGSKSDPTYMFTTPIAHVSVPINQITRGELWAIFTLAVTQWDDGQRIAIVIYVPDNQIQKAFLREYFGMNTYRYQEIIDGKINTGRASPPIVVETEQQMISEVSKKPGRIGFTKSYVLVGERNGIKHIQIN